MLVVASQKGMKDGRPETLSPSHNLFMKKDLTLFLK
jgi:hypothetical protein